MMLYLPRNPTTPPLPKSNIVIIFYLTSTSLIKDGIKGSRATKECDKQQKNRGGKVLKH